MFFNGHFRNNAYNSKKKYNEIQLTKKKMNFDNRKIKDHPPFPGSDLQKCLTISRLSCSNILFVL